MALLKNLIVSGDTKLIGDTNAGKVTATQFVKSGGTSSQFLKADGSVDSSTESGAQANKIETIKINNVTQTISNKAVNMSLLTNLQNGGNTKSIRGIGASISATGYGSFAAGECSDLDGHMESSGNGSFVYGYCPGGSILANGNGSVAIGISDNPDLPSGDPCEIQALGDGAIALGCAKVSSGGIYANGNGSVAIGNINCDYGGSITSSSKGSFALGCSENDGDIIASGDGSVASGYSKFQGAIQATEQGAFASGYVNNAAITASNKGAFATGYSDGDNSITASGLGSIAHGYTDGGSGNIKAIGKGSHAEGTSTEAIGNYSHAEGKSTVAYGTGSKSEGTRTSSITISGVSGSGTSYTSSNASKLYKGALLNSGLTYARVVSISGNSFTVNNTLGSMSSDYVLMIRGCASGDYSHSEGSGSAYGVFSHAEGNETIASEDGSHAEGVGTIAQNLAEHAEGRYNKSNKANDTYGNAGNTQHSIGIGTGSSARVNAVEVMQNGDVYIKGIGGYNGTNPGASGVKSVQTVISELTTALSGLEQVLASI